MGRLQLAACLAHLHTRPEEVDTNFQGVGAASAFPMPSICVAQKALQHK